jgi:hypothetical protein
MANKATDNIDNERLRIHHAFWLSMFGLALAAVLAVFLVVWAELDLTDSSEVAAVVGLFTSVTGTLVGSFLGLQIGAAGAEHERRSRREAEEGRHKAEQATRVALAHLPPDTAKEILNALQHE